MHARCTAALFGLAILVAAPFAHPAEGRTSSLSWLRMPGADSCIATQALARAVEERLGRKVFVSAAEADVSVEGRIEKRKDHWHAIISVRDGKGLLLGNRELDRKEESCESMSEPLALVIAVMIDPEAASRKTDPPPPPPATTTTAAAGSSDSPPPPLPDVTAKREDGPPPPPPKKAEPWRFEGDAAATLSSGLTPSLAAGAGVEAILYPPGIPLGFRGFTMLFLPTTAGKDDARATFDMLYVGGALCPTWRTRVSLMACIGGQLGVLRPKADTPNKGISEDALPVWNALVEGRISIPIVAPVMASAGVSAALPLIRPQFEYTAPGGGTAILHKVSPVAFTGSAGLGFFFP